MYKMGRDFGEERLKNLHQDFGAKCLTFILPEYSWFCFAPIKKVLLCLLYHTNGSLKAFPGFLINLQMRRINKLSSRIHVRRIPKAHCWACILLTIPTYKIRELNEIIPSFHPYLIFLKYSISGLSSSLVL